MQTFRQWINGDDFELGLVVIEHLHAWVIHRPVIAVPLRLAAERDLLTIAHLADDHERIEPDAGNAFALRIGDDNANALPASGNAFALRIGDDNAGDAPAVVQLLAVDLDDLALHRLQDAGFDLFHAANLREI